MSKSQFIINYVGTKFRESKHLDIDIDKYDTIIEPFGGSFGYSRYLWLNKEKCKDKKYIIYDTNKELIDLYNHLKETDIEIFLKEYNSLCDNVFDLFKTGKDKSQIKTKDSIKWIDENVDDVHLKFLLIQNIKSSPISRVYWKLNIAFKEMFKCCEFIHQDFTTIDLSIYDNEKTLIYLDPPYAFECNGFYKVSDEDTLYKNFWERLIHLFKNDKFNCLLIHSYNYLVDYILKEYAYQEYDIKYGTTGNIRKHIVYLKSI
tara:strand:+ start:87 stop:866 length:780 start_codon:yes stop_codon:yes gene_type:complete